MEEFTFHIDNLNYQRHWKRPLSGLFGSLMSFYFGHMKAFRKLKETKCLKFVESRRGKNFFIYILTISILVSNAK